MAASDWQPLTDIWETYNSSLNRATENGWIDDPELQDSYVWPVDLQIGEGEQKDMKKYVQDRLVEVVERVQAEKGLNPSMLAGLVFRSVICGMMWEAERRGRT